MPEIVWRFLLWALSHSLLATDRVKERLCRNRPLLSRNYRIGYNLVALGSFAWVAAAFPGSQTLYALSGFPCLVLRGVQLCALLLLCRCAAQTGLGEFLGLSRLMTGTEEPPRFTRSGCYARVRHPLYSLATVILVAAPTVTVNHLLFTLLSALYFLLGGAIEETRLCERFGDDYRRYREEVPMFLPLPARKGSRRCP